MRASPMTVDDLPGLNCGLCGARSCTAFAERLSDDPDLIQRCIPLSTLRVRSAAQPTGVDVPVQAARASGVTQAAPLAVVPAAGSPAGGAPPAGSVAGTGPVCGGCPPGSAAPPFAVAAATVAGTGGPAWVDTLGRPIDFYLEHFPEDPGPREIILPHNPMLTRELEVTEGDVLIGRPLGMSCGCPVTHCGIARSVDSRTGVIVWCVTGPLDPRQHGFKDLGYYIAEGYEGLVRQTRVDMRIGMRYFFQPRMCMLQWRHSGLVNYLNHGSDGAQIRLEGLWIG